MLFLTIAAFKILVKIHLKKLLEINRSNKVVKNYDTHRRVVRKKFRHELNEKLYFCHGLGGF